MFKKMRVLCVHMCCISKILLISNYVIQGYLGIYAIVWTDCPFLVAPIVSHEFDDRLTTALPECNIFSNCFASKSNIIKYI